MTIRPSTIPLTALLAVLAVSVPARAAAPAAMTKAGCLVCHAEDKPVLGPSFKDIAAKNKGKKDAAAVLAKRVRVGSTGVYGKLPMPATGPDKISDADLAAAIDHILKR